MICGPCVRARWTTSLNRALASATDHELLRRLVRLIILVIIVTQIGRHNCRRKHPACLWASGVAALMLLAACDGQAAPSVPASSAPAPKPSAAKSAAASAPASAPAAPAAASKPAASVSAV